MTKIIQQFTYNELTDYLNGLLASIHGLARLPLLDFYLEDNISLAIEPFIEEYNNDKLEEINEKFANSIMLDKGFYTIGLYGRSNTTCAPSNFVDDDGNGFCMKQFSVEEIKERYSIGELLQLIGELTQLCEIVIQYCDELEYENRIDNALMRRGLYPDDYKKYR